MPVDCTGMYRIYQVATQFYENNANVGWSSRSSLYRWYVYAEKTHIWSIVEKCSFHLHPIWCVFYLLSAVIFFCYGFKVHSEA